ncbi:hypothetical protein EZV62_024102 [Acer yangbiense]|uniref:Uncharacterized protein n=1 Tax=Acer yangbiense TaxID=1000413 RepID=A0A5C7H3N8_9ROSI|nr:hypothetical protein EZV62_024102 [Acer yangbiense]
MVLLQPNLHNDHNLYLSLTISYSSPLPCKNPSFTTSLQSAVVKSKKFPVIRCSIFQVYDGSKFSKDGLYGGVDLVEIVVEEVKYRLMTS